VRDAHALGNPSTIARSEYWLGYMYYGVGRSHEGIAHCKQALQIALRIDDDRLAAQVKAALGQLLAATCQYDEAITLIGEAVDSKRRRSRPGSGMAIGSAYSLACKGSVLADRGSFADAHDCFAEALELLGGSTHPVATSVRNWFAISHLWQGEWAAAEGMADDSVRIAESTGALLLVATSRANRGYARWMIGGREEEFEQLTEAVRWMEHRQGAFFTSLYYGWLVEGYLTQGQVEPARAHAARLLRRSRAHERLGEAVGCRALAEAAARSRDFVGAERHLARAGVSAQLRGSPREAALNALCCAKVARHKGRPAEVHRWLDEAAHAFEVMNMRWYLLEAQRLRDSNYLC
jgi:tetratricopeptide (TPR) repeat protein